jgi:hypothetical protein
MRRELHHHLFVKCGFHNYQTHKKQDLRPFVNRNFSLVDAVNQRVTQDFNGG